jgi:C1A family cysteine protease
MRKLGYLRGRADTRDIDARETLKAIKVPASASLRQHVVHVLDQGALGSCVANAGFQGIRMAQHRQGAANPPLGSRLWGYYLARAQHGQQLQDSGTYIREFFRAVVKFGFPPEQAWPYQASGDKFKKMPGPEVFREAYDQRSPTVYRRIFAEGIERTRAIKQAIAGGYPVVFGTDVSEAFCNDELDQDGIAPPVREPIAGGHAMTVVAYDGDVFEVCNSWGTGWGDAGFCAFSAAYLQWGQTNDLWIVESAPPLVA